MPPRRSRRLKPAVGGDDDLGEIEEVASRVPRGKSKAKAKCKALAKPDDVLGQELEVTSGTSHGQEEVQTPSFPDVETAPEKHDKHCSEDVEDPSTVPRITPGMRYIFYRDFEVLPPKVQSEYNRLKVSREPGKQQEMNRIIYLAVKQTGDCDSYRGFVETNDRQWLQFFKKIEEKYADHRLEGYSYTEIKALLGGADEVTAGKVRGDIVVSVDANGREWFHMGRQSSGLKRQTRSLQEVGQSNSDITAEDLHVASEDMQDEDWLKFATTLSQMSEMSNSSASSHTSPAAVASDMILSKVQETYDALNTVSKNLRSKSIELKGKVDTTITSFAEGPHGFQALRPARRYFDPRACYVSRAHRERSAHGDRKKLPRHQSNRERNLEVAQNCLRQTAETPQGACRLSLQIQNTVEPQCYNQSYDFAKCRSTGTG